MASRGLGLLVSFLHHWLAFPQQFGVRRLLHMLSLLFSILFNHLNIYLRSTYRYSMTKGQFSNRKISYTMRLVHIRAFQVEQPSCILQRRALYR
ncbi:hypothetical protein DFS34DRAFT_603863 [Phlyctochytrium arcticum]|nr:hypothetical protein DFS34DRAFT_603863 [Phlyctochytrium arcticum]